jgi:hypothetical protein
MQTIKSAVLCVDDPWSSGVVNNDRATKPGAAT